MNAFETVGIDRDMIQMKFVTPGSKCISSIVT